RIPTPLCFYREFRTSPPSACNTPSSSAYLTRTFNVVSCQPFFGDFHLAPLTPPSTIQLFLPTSLSGLATDLQAGIDAWNAVLPSSVQFEITGEDCGTGASCIAISVDENQTSCGYSNANRDSGGNVTGSATMKLKFTWYLWDSDEARRTFMHELGHFLGLDDSNADACLVTDAIMQDMFSCTGTTNPLHTLTTNDSAPVGKSVY